MRARTLLRAGAASALTLLVYGFQSGGTNTADQLAQARNLGKAFYENPTTQKEAVEQFQKALDLAPDSPRERINYGLALLHAGQTEQGIAELEKAQKQDPKIPHTWFNLGIAFKNDSRTDDAIREFQGVINLIPDEPVSNYNLGVLYRLSGKPEDAVKEFRLSEKYNPDLAGPHFALATARRQSTPEDAAKENAMFLQIRERQKGSAVPEDLSWSYYAEIYDPAESLRSTSPAAAEYLLKTNKVSSNLGTDSGLAVADVDGDGTADLIAWSSNGIQVFKSGSAAIDCGLSALKDVVAIVPGDFNNDGLADLAIITKSGAELWTNAAGKFSRSSVKLPAGSYANAVWLDYDHDYDLDLFLLGEHSVLMRNNGEAGFSDETKSFPFVSGHATAGVEFDVIPDTDSMDLAVAYAGPARRALSRSSQRTLRSD